MRNRACRNRGLIRMRGGSNSGHRSSLANSIQRVVCTAVLAGMTVGCASLCAQSSNVDLSGLTLDNLSSIQITSVSRREQKLSEAASAIYVITADDIGRSGLTTVPELLRMVPGVEVAQVDANKWAVTVRGFAGLHADRMLVLIDGRTIYSELSSSVSWSVELPLLDDIDRIEVIRGPGATLWGANAVNGVVNIVTKSAKDTKGLLLTGAVAAHNPDSGSVRAGGTLGPSTAYRASASYLATAGLSPKRNGYSPDEWHDARISFRTDADLSGNQSLLLEGDFYKDDAGATIPAILSYWPLCSGLVAAKAIGSGGDLQTRWTIKSPRFETVATAYLDISRQSGEKMLQVFRHSFDLDVLERYHPQGGHNDVLFGADFRDNADRTIGNLNIEFNPAKSDKQLYGAFLQDETSWFRDRLRLTIGTKLEHNFFSGYALQPNGRAIWLPKSGTAIWAASSRASESPSRIDADARLNANPHVGSDGVLTIFSAFGAEHTRPESVTAYESGVRLQPAPRLSFDLAAFYNYYTDQHSSEPGTPFYEADPAPLHRVLPSYTRNLIFGETHGAELALTEHVMRDWRLTGSASLFEIHLRPSAGGHDVKTGPDTEGMSPHVKAQLHSQWTVERYFDIDSSMYFVGKLPGPPIPSYTRLDAGAGWHPNSAFALNFGGRNLLQERHYEFPSGDGTQAEPNARNGYVGATWRF